MNAPVSSVTTLPELLRWRAFFTPLANAFTIEDKSYTFNWLWENCLSFASMLQEEKVKEKERILISVPNSAGFFLAFYGSILCGAIPVPVFPDAGTDRCFALMQLCGSRNIILPSDCKAKRKDEFIRWADDNQFRIHWVNESPESGPPIYFPEISGFDIAFIQYTSGSTDFPKGIPLTHHNLLTNIRQMVEAMDISSKDVFVSWLPVYHDMGLILNTMVPFYTGAGLVLLGEGLHRIHSWLKAIEQYKGTFISAPDTAYRLCVKGIRRPDDYNLSSLRVALNASEPIHLQTCRKFEEAFRLENVMVSGYGLAEATVAVTMHPPGQPLRIDKNGYVASGLPVKGTEIRIDTEKASSVENPAGEILVKSPAQMSGYYRKIKEPDPFDESGYLRTGDIGYLDREGYLFVLARKKNIIKQAGYTLYPDDVEQVLKSMGDVRLAAAIGIEQLPASGESLYVFAELKWHECPSKDKCHELAVEIVQRIYDHFGIRPGRVFLVRPKTLPHTPNGKLQHTVLKNLYLNDFQQINKIILYPSNKMN